MLRNKTGQVGVPRGVAVVEGVGREAKLKEHQILEKKLQSLKQQLNRKKKKKNKDHDQVKIIDPPPEQKTIKESSLEHQVIRIKESSLDHQNDHNHDFNHHQELEKSSVVAVEEQQSRPGKRKEEEEERDRAIERETEDQGQEVKDQDQDQDQSDFYLLSPVFKPKKSKRPRIHEEQQQQQPKVESSIDEDKAGGKDFSFDESIGHSQGMLKEPQMELGDGESQVERLVESSMEENQAHYWSNHSLPQSSPTNEDQGMEENQPEEESPPQTPEQIEAPETNYDDETTQQTPLQETQAAPSQTNFELDFRTLVNKLKNQPVSPIPNEEETQATPSSNRKEQQSGTGTGTPQRLMSSSPPPSPSPAMTPLVATQLASTQNEEKAAPFDFEGLFTKMKGAGTIPIPVAVAEAPIAIGGVDNTPDPSPAAVVANPPAFPPPSPKGNLGGKVPIFNFPGVSARRQSATSQLASSPPFTIPSRSSPSSLSKGTFASPLSPNKPFVALTVDPASPLPTLRTVQHPPPSRPHLGPTPSKEPRPGSSPITKVQVFSPTSNSKQKKPSSALAPAEKPRAAPPVSLVRCLRHRGSILAAQLSPTSKKLSVCLAHSIRVYDTETWNPLAEFSIPAHPEKISTIQWIPDDGETTFILSLIGNHEGDRVLGVVFSLLPERKPLVISDSAAVVDVDQAVPSTGYEKQSLLFPRLHCFLAASTFSGKILKISFDSNWGEIQTRAVISFPPSVQSSKATGSLSQLEGDNNQFLWVTPTLCFLGDAARGTIVKSLDFTKVLSPKHSLLVSCLSAVVMNPQPPGNNCNLKPFAATLEVIDGSGLRSIATVAVHGEKMVQLNSVAIGSYSGPMASDSQVLCVTSNPSTVKLYSLSTMHLDAVIDTSAGIPHKGVIKSVQVHSAKSWIVVGTEDGCVHMYSFPMYCNFQKG